MELIISHKGIKRQIDGSFRICCSRKALKRIRKAIKHDLKKNKQAIYGWCEIEKGAPDVINTVPREWG